MKDQDITEEEVIKNLRSSQDQYKETVSKLEITINNL